MAVAGVDALPEDDELEPMVTGLFRPARTAGAWLLPASCRKSGDLGEGVSSELLHELEN